MNNNIDSKIKERKELKSKLGYGDIVKIAALADTERTTVHRWFKGETDNPDIALAVDGLIALKTQIVSERLKKLANKK
ncbi:hypothetical protein [uncultured Dokdonia sp.]|uniref:hypothetical protein n=1 Tax=uncultured Dokdonia sp. TaxID=575653 RepID=UPI002629AAF3|nr:hypothetical protein [uncultured Dokdonia sp.]